MFSRVNKKISKIIMMNKLGPLDGNNIQHQIRLERRPNLLGVAAMLGQPPRMRKFWQRCFYFASFEVQTTTAIC